MQSDFSPPFAYVTGANRKPRAQTEQGKFNKALFSTYICERRGTASKNKPHS